MYVGRQFFKQSTSKSISFISWDHDSFTYQSRRQQALAQQQTMQKRAELSPMVSQIHQRIFPSSSLAHDCVWARLRWFFGKEASTFTPPPRDRWLPCGEWLTLMTVSATLMVLASPGVLIRASTIPFGRHDIVRRRQKNRVERKDLMLVLWDWNSRWQHECAWFLFCFGMWQWITSLRLHRLARLKWWYVIVMYLCRDCLPCCVCEMWAHALCTVVFCLFKLSPHTALPNRWILFGHVHACFLTACPFHSVTTRDWVVLHFCSIESSIIFHRWYRLCRASTRKDWD